MLLYKQIQFSRKSFIHFVKSIKNLTKEKYILMLVSYDFESDINLYKTILENSQILLRDSLVIRNSSKLF